MTTKMREELSALLVEIDSFEPELYPPPAKLDHDEEVIGVVEDRFLRQLWSYATFHDREARQVELEMNYSSDDTLTALHKLGRHSSRAETVRELFWYLVRVEFDFFEVGGIGVRQGWRFIHKNSDRQDPRQMLRKFLGGGE